MSKKKVYIFLGIAVVIIVSLIILSKLGILGHKNIGKEVEIATVTEMTIIETVSATGKIQPETEIKISSEVSGEIIDLPLEHLHKQQLFCPTPI